MTSRPIRTLLLAGALFALTVPAHAANSLFTFGEMQRLQALPMNSAERALSDQEIILYQNMEFYAVSAFEALLAANTAAERIHDEPIFCAPAKVFSFRKEGEIARLTSFLTEELLALTDEIGADLDRYDDRPAAEVLLLGLRAAFPCQGEGPTLSAMR